MILRNDKRRLQFSLNSLLLVVTLLCAILAVGAVWPRIALVVVPVSAFIALVVFALIAIDQILQRDRPIHSVPIGSILLIAASAWTIIFVPDSFLDPHTWGSRTNTIRRRKCSGDVRFQSPRWNNAFVGR